MGLNIKKGGSTEETNTLNTIERVSIPKNREHQNIVIKAFEKTKNRVEKKGVKVSFTKISEDLSIFLNAEHSVSFSDKSLRTVYKGETSIKKEKVLIGLCQFLDYKDYEDYKEKHVYHTKLSKRHSPFIKKEWSYILILFIGVFILMIASFINKSKLRWIIWSDDHYEEVNYNSKVNDFNQLLPYNQEKIELQKKIEGSCNTDFFDEIGNPKVWYSKVSKKKLDLFTSHGLHPETKKTLKPITCYMIKKYICEDYKMCKK